MESQSWSCCWHVLTWLNTNSIRNDLFHSESPGPHTSQPEAHSGFSGLCNRCANAQQTAATYSPQPEQTCYMTASSFFYSNIINIKKGKSFINFISKLRIREILHFFFISWLSSPNLWQYISMNWHRLHSQQVIIESLWANHNQTQKVDWSNLHSHANPFQTTGTSGLKTKGINHFSLIK